MSRTPKLPALLARLLPHKREYQTPVGWWKDAKGRSQPPGSYLDPSLRVDSDGLPLVESKRLRSRR